MHLYAYILLLPPPALIALILALHLVSHLTSTRTPATLARLLSALLTLFTCAAYGLLATLYLQLTSRPGLAQYATARAFAALMPYTTGLTFYIESGAHHLAPASLDNPAARTPAVLLGNHQSALDVLFLAAVWPRYCSVTAKRELSLWPVLGWFMTASGTVFLDRANRTRALGALDGAADRVVKEMAQSVFLFPEGTRRAGPEAVLGAFKKGGVHLAVKAGVPVVPVVCANYWGVLAVREGRFEAGRVPVRVLPPVPTTGLTVDDVEVLTNRIRDTMLKELIALSETPAGRKAIGADLARAGPAAAAAAATTTNTITAAATEEEEEVEVGMRGGGSGVATASGVER